MVYPFRGFIDAGEDRPVGRQDRGGRSEVGWRAPPEQEQRHQERGVTAGADHPNRVLMGYPRRVRKNASSVSMGIRLRSS